MAVPQHDRRSFVYADYLHWPDGERWELLAGEAVAMTSPGRVHQEIQMNLLLSLGPQIRAQSDCSFFAAPFDVRLAEVGESDMGATNVVQPDLLLVCDASRIDDRGVKGAPDLAIEILSPTTAALDLQIKKELYERHGVREYWIVQPGERLIIVYVLEEGTFDRGTIYTEADEITMRVLPTVRCKAKDVFLRG